MCREKVFSRDENSGAELGDSCGQKQRLSPAPQRVTGARLTSPENGVSARLSGTVFTAMQIMLVSPVGCDPPNEQEIVANSVRYSNRNSSCTFRSQKPYYESTQFLVPGFHFRPNKTAVSSHIANYCSFYDRITFFQSQGVKALRVRSKEAGGGGR